MLGAEAQSPKHLVELTGFLQLTQVILAGDLDKAVVHGVASISWVLHHGSHPCHGGADVMSLDALSKITEAEASELRELVVHNL